jgi:hypothetical protein
MDALTARCGNRLLAASACVVLAVWNQSPARADAPAGRGACTTTCLEARERNATGIVAEPGKASDALTALGLAGAVCFDTPNVPPVVPPDTPPAPPPDTPPPPGPPGGGPPPGGPPPGGPPPNIPPPNIPPPSVAPEPSSLLIGLMGSAFAVAAMWRRRRGAKSQ